MSFGITVSAIGSLVAIVAFFLPWVSYAKGDYSGVGIVSTLGLSQLGGFAFAPVLVVVAAIVSGAFVLGSGGATGERAARLRLWSAAAAVAGLAIGLLFLGSTVLEATGTGFAPATIRTDNAVKASLSKALDAGAFAGVGVGLYLTIAGLLAATLGALLGRGAATDESTWRTQDVVLLAIVAVVFGAIYFAWVTPYLAVFAVQPAAEMLFGVWFTAGLLGAYVIRRPGAAFLAETLTAAAEVLFGAPAGPILVVTGMMEALGAELVFAATGYRRWGLATLILAGVAAAVVALPWNWFRLGYFALDPALLVGLLVIRVVSGGLAGVAAKAVGDLLAATGSLNQFKLGRERVKEV